MNVLLEYEELYALPVTERTSIIGRVKTTMTKRLRQQPTGQGPKWLRQDGATVLALGCLFALSGCGATDPLPTACSPSSR